MVGRLKEFRLKADLTQKELATEVGVSQGYIAKLEKNDPKAEQITLSLINRIAKALDIAPSELIDYGVVFYEKVKVMGEVGVGLWSDTPFWGIERQYTTKTMVDDRFEAVIRFGLEMLPKLGEEKSVAFFVPIERIPKPFELNKEYLVQRRNERGQYELTIRVLKKGKDGEFWLELVEDEDDPALKAPIPYYPGSPTVTILARVSGATQFK